MSAMGGMPMPGSWTLSMAWMRMDGQSWLGVAASFLGMWAPMMMAMMLPALLPMLWRYHQAVERTGERRLAALTALVGMGYFVVWIGMGVPVFVVGAALAALALQWPLLARGVPVAIGATVLLAGALQFSARKARRLACCRTAPARYRDLPSNLGTAWEYGLRLGVHCSHCCAGLMAIPLVMGMMDLRVMAAATAAITFERIAPTGWRAARVIGVATLGTGLMLTTRALGFG